MPNNPSGRNQYAAIPGPNDEILKEALTRYHREKLTSNKRIAVRLKQEYNIEMSIGSIKRRRNAFGLKGSRAKEKDKSLTECEQLVLKQLDRDPTNRLGVNSIMQKVAFEEGVHLSGHFVSDIMHRHNPGGFAMRQPCSKKIMRFPKHPIGPNERWAADGHDKLKHIGFPIYAILDDATGKYLGLYVVPDNRDVDMVAYCYLDVVEKQGGIPMQVSTDCGTETTKLFGVVNSLRERFCPEMDSAILPAHVYLRSVHNITVERGWVRMRFDFTDDALAFYNAGIDTGKCDLHDPDQRELCRWLWGVLLRQEANKFVTFRNGVPMRKMHHKAGPSGMSRNEAYSVPGTWGGRECLIRVDLSVVRAMKEELGGEALFEFTSLEYSKRARAIYDTLGIVNLAYQNVWDIFAIMYARLQ